MEISDPTEKCVKGESQLKFINSAPVFSFLVVQILKDATLLFSRKTPNLASVIPAMDHIDQVFTNQSLDPAIDPPIRSAIIRAKHTLNRYYTMTDWSNAYRIAMGIQFLSFDVIYS